MESPSGESFLVRIAQAVDGGETVAVVTFVEATLAEANLVENPGSERRPLLKALVSSSGQVLLKTAESPYLSKAAQIIPEMIQTGRNTDLIDPGDCSGVRFAIEILRPRPEVIVFGAGHVGSAVAALAAAVGYAVTVVDDRPEFAGRTRLPDPAIRIVTGDFVQAARSLRIGQNAAVAIVTRGHQHDEACLRVLAESGAGYIGMIGSKRRVISIFKRLSESGVDSTLLQRVRAPIGLAIGAQSPQEIAVAILAEIIQAFNNPAGAEPNRGARRKAAPE